MHLRTTSQFKRDARRIQRRGKDLAKLRSVVERISRNEPLDPRHRPHRWAGGMAGAWECHIEPDWLLVWKQTDDAAILVRTGTHSDIFG